MSTLEPQLKPAEDHIAPLNTSKEYDVEADLASLKLESEQMRAQFYPEGGEYFYYKELGNGDIALGVELAEQKITSFGGRIAQAAESLSGVSVEDIQSAIDAQQKSAFDELNPQIEAIDEKQEALARERNSIIWRGATDSGDIKDYYAAYAHFMEHGSPEDQERIHEISDSSKKLLHEKSILTRKLFESGLSSNENIRAKIETLTAGYREALSRVRNFGGELTTAPRSSVQGTAVLQAALVDYPSDWIKSSNNFSVPLLVTAGSVRAHYSPQKISTPQTNKALTRSQEFDADEIHKIDNWRYHNWEKTEDLPDGSSVWSGPSWERVVTANLSFTGHPVFRPASKNGIKLRDADGDYIPPKNVVKVVSEADGQRSVTYIRQAVAKVATGESKQVGKLQVETGENSANVAVHEFAHRIEHANSHLKTLQEAFLVRRTTDEAGKREPLVRYQGRKSELVRGDQFASVYMGKIYVSGHREVLSTGMEAIFHNSYGGLSGFDGKTRDDDMKNFVLGLLVST